MTAAPANSPFDLSVVIPAWGEAGNLRPLLPALSEALNALGVAWEIIVVDAGRDETQAVCEAVPGVRRVRQQSRGYGGAILEGAESSTGAYILTMDADLSHPAAFVESLWARRSGADIVIASRYVPGGRADQPRLRLVLSKVLNAFFRKGLHLEPRDLSSGFRLYRRAVFEKITPKYRNFVILIEILIRALAEGMTIAEAPFHYAPRKKGVSKARILRFGLNYLMLFHQTWRMRNSVQFPDYDWRAHSSIIPLQRYWQRKRYAWIVSMTPPGKTCDVGCGSSRILPALPNCTGVDLRHDKLAFMRTHHARLVQASGMNLPFPDAAFDNAVCSQVIEHIAGEDGRLIDELARILKPGGTLVLGTPDYGRWEWRTLEWFYGKVVPGAYAHEHVNRYTRTSLCAALHARGFRLEQHAYILRGELIVRAVKAGA